MMSLGDFGIGVPFDNRAIVARTRAAPSSHKSNQFRSTMYAKFANTHHRDIGVDLFFSYFGHFADDIDLLDVVGSEIGVAAVAGHTNACAVSSSTFTRANPIRSNLLLFR